MKNQRRHTRYRLRLIDIESKVFLAGRADIVDMSLGGVLLRTEGRLAIGRECSILFSYRGMQYPVKGRVVRSEMSGVEERAGGRSVVLYLVGIMFMEGSEGTVKEFLDSIEQSEKTVVPATANWRFRDVQFNLTTPSEKVLEFPAQFTIRDISKRGVIIQTEQQLHVEHMVLLELSLDAAPPARFMGKVVSCRPSRDQGQEGYAVGVEFSDLTEQADDVIRRFMESLKNNSA
jgi:Tfp pilus assembly protein PilZ